MRTPSNSLPTSGPVYLGMQYSVTSWPALASRGVSSVTNVSNPPHLAGTPRAPKMEIFMWSDGSGVPPPVPKHHAFDVR